MSLLAMSQKNKIKELAKNGMNMNEIEQVLYMLHGESSFKPSTLYKCIAEAKSRGLHRNVELF